MRVLAIGAQPGEIELACGGTLACHTRRGDAVAIVCISNGNLSHDTIPPDELAETRRDESRNAAKALGAELYWLDNSDFAIEDEPVTTMKLVEIIRDFRPDALITHSPAGDRPDHSSSHALTLRASIYGGGPPTRRNRSIHEGRRAYLRNGDSVGRWLRSHGVRGHHSGNRHQAGGHRMPRHISGLPEAGPGGAIWWKSAW